MTRHRERNCRALSATLMVACGVALLIGFVLAGPADSRGPTKTGLPPSLPPDLFVSTAPGGAINVGDARKTGREGGTVVVRGRIGGMAKPFADKYAVFVLSDQRLPLCQEGCSTPWDYCCTPRESIVSNLATIQVVDEGGRPLKTSLKGVHGLAPSSDVIVSGTVAKMGKNFMILNAGNIYVIKDSPSQGRSSKPR